MNRRSALKKLREVQALRALRALRPRKVRTPPGAPPGTLVPDPMAPKPILTAMAYGENGLTEVTLASPRDALPLLESHPVVWINVDGLGDADVLRQLGEVFHLHPLALEDVLNTMQRPKVDPYPEHLFIVSREIAYADHLTNEQLSLFLGKNYVISFQETRGDCFAPVRGRLRDPSSRIRKLGPDYLAYALLDATVDSYFPVLEKIGDCLDELEPALLVCPKPGDVRRLHAMKRDLFHLRRAAWPLREALNVLVRDDSQFIRPETRTFLRDCVDHAIQILDLVETDRELCSDLMDVYLWSVSHRMNSVMKVLTIISTIFIPLTFIAGVYGMNFHTNHPLNMPELEWKYGYLVFWIVCVAVGAGLLVLFWRLGWLSDDSRER